MANSNNPYAFPAPHQDQSSFNQNYLQQPMTNPEDITDPTTAMNMTLALMAKAFKLNYTTPTNNNQRISSNPRNMQIAQPGMNMGHDRQMQVVGGNGNQNQIRNGNLVVAHAEGNTAGQNGNQIRCYNCRGTDSAPVYDTDGSAEVHENCDDNEIFNMFTQEEQYTELLEPIPESHQVPQNDNDVISEDTSVEQGEEIVEQHPANFEETHAIYESLYQNLAIEVEKVNSVNRMLKEANADLTTKLVRFKNQERFLKLVKKNMTNLKDVINKETLQLAQESRDKIKQMNKEIKPANYTKINHLSGVFVPQKALSREELYFSNNSKTANVSKSFLIPNEDLSDDTTPSVAHKFLNE
nr:hypothetical protein [Tanacetum cinerariifolium]